MNPSEVRKDLKKQKVVVEYDARGCIKYTEEDFIWWSNIWVVVTQL